MKRRTKHRFLCLLLVVLMIVSLLPMAALAVEAETSTWERVELADIKADDTVAITMTTKDGAVYALPSTEKGTNGQPNAVTAEPDGDTITIEGGKADFGWTITPGDADTWKIQSLGGEFLYLTADNNGVRVGNTEMVWSLANGYLNAKDSKNAVRYLGVYQGTDWRCYTNTTGNTKDQTVGFWKHKSSENSDLALQSAAEAKQAAKGKLCSVKGVVTMLDGKSVYVQDASGGICLFLKGAPADLSLGDTVSGVGRRGDYNGLPQLQNATYTKGEGMTLTAAEKTGIAAITADDVCTYVKLSDVEVTEVYDNNGKYSNPNITVKDTTGATIQIYKAIVDKDADGAWAVKVGDIVTVSAAVSISNKTLQLRNTVASEIVVKGEESEEAKTGLVTDLADLTDGARIVIFNPANSKALSQTYSGFNNTGVDVTLADGKLSGYGETEIWTVGVNEDSSYTFSTADGKKIAMGASYSSMPLDEVNPNWKLIPAEGGAQGFYIENTVRENARMEWYASKTYWSAYDKDNTGDLFVQQLYLVGDETPDVPQPDGAKFGLTSKLADGDKVILYNAANGMALGNAMSGYNVAGVALTPADGVITTDKEAVVWTVGVNSDGTYTFTQGDKTLGGVVSENNGKTYNNLVLTGAAYQNWTLTGPDSSDFNYFLRLDDMANNFGKTYLEYHNGFTLYGSSAPTKDAFGITFYKQGADPETPSGEEPSGDMIKAGDKVVIYNAEAKGALGLDSAGMGTSLGNIPTDIREGNAYPNNGAYVFTVGVEGDYYTFSAGGKYLSTCNTEQLFMADEKLDTGDSCAYWQLEKKGDGCLIKSKTARYNGTGVVVIEFYAGAFSGYTFKSDNQAIFLFNFYPVHSTISTLDDVTNVPSIVFDTEDAPVKQQAYTVKFTLDDLTPLEQLTVTATLNGEPVTNLQNDGKTFSFDVPAEVTAVESALTIDVQVTNASGDSYSLAVTMLVQDIPVFSNFKPEPGSETGDNKMPLISADVKNVSDRDSAVITIAGKTYPAQIQNGVVSYQPTEPLKDGRTTVRVEVTRQDGATGEASWSFVVGTATTRLYFGQLHSHTTYSDGSGSLPTALEYVKNLPESANVQFVAFTDHSNYFDSNSAANPEGALYDMSLATPTSQELWKNYRKTVADFNASQTDVIAIAGFEMTWSGGPGHINTFNSPGIVSRNNTTLNQKTNDAGMKSYYALLSKPEGAETLSQFNHPGKTFGNFTDFSYWDAVTDSRIFLVEVGNGEGQIGAGGYYPSYEQYIMALDKGWHVAPTNNQDNHKGRWGNANDARDVILTDDFSEEGIYQAIRDMRVYATEDKNLEVYYTVNEQPLGSSLSEVPEQLNLNVQVNDPDSGDRISKVEVVVNSGKVVHTWDDASALAAGTLTVTLAPNYSYYFIRVTEADGDLAVTAPVWVGEMLKLGISAFESETAMPVTGEELTLKTTLYNSEGKEATIKNITYTTSGSKVLGVDTTGGTVPASGTKEIEFKFTPEVAKVMTITVTVVMEQDGKEFTFTKDLTLDVQNADELVYIGIDASHHNEYVAGNYKDSMGNFANLAAEHAVRTVYLKTSEELIAACGSDKYKAIILTAPSRRDGSSLRNPYENYTDAEIAAIAAFNANGGTVVLTGWSDYYEHYAAFTAADHMAAQQNRILAALGSSLRISDDGTNDDELNGGQTPRLYFDTFNMDNPLMAGVVVDPDHPNDRAYSEVFSHYGGASIYAVDGSGAPTTELPATVCPAVYAHATTYSWDSDDDGIGGASVPKYPVGEGDNRLLIMATEELPGKGLIVVSGAAFLSNFEVQAQISDGSSDADTQKNYSNYKVCENLISPMNTAKVSDISDVRAVTEDGFKFTIEGTVTSNASGYDKDTAFFDCIYVQDETGGICCFPVAGNFKVGDKVRVTGTTDFYQGEPELQVTSIAVIGEGEVKPQEVSAKDVTSRAVEGKLITVKGTVESFELANGLVQTIMVKDAKGDVVRVFIDGYITTGSEVKDLEKGCDITVTGLASYDDTFNAPDGPFPRIRVRDRADVICTAKHTPDKCDGGASCPSKQFTDVDRTPDSWSHEAIDWAVVKKVTDGKTDTTFAPNESCTRAQAVTFLWRAKNSPEPKSTKCDFTDVDPGAYYYKAVLWAVENKITDGMTETTFVPEDTCTRGQIVTFLWRAENKPAPKAASSFTDVPADMYFTDAVAWAVHHDPQITDGVTETTFEPNSNCTRAHIVTFLYRDLGAK